MSEETVVRWCAPTLACLKTGSMFTCAFADRADMTHSLQSLNRSLRDKGLRAIALRYREGRGLIYLYRPHMLARDLESGIAHALLAECGYQREEPSQCLAELCRRLRGNEDFPHEIGLFLGYPPADVEGFMHRRDDFKASGMWKVYDDVDGAKRTFRRYKRCTENYIRRCRNGSSLRELSVATPAEI